MFGFNASFSLGMSKIGINLRLTVNTEADKISAFKKIVTGKNSRITR